MIELTKEQVTKIEDSVKEFCNWQGAATIMFDEEDNECWCDIFTSSNDTNVYHSDTIYPVVGKDDLHGRNDRYSKAGIVNIIRNQYYHNPLCKTESEAYFRASY